MSDTEVAQLQARLDCEHQIALEAEEMREAAVLECEQQRQRADEAEQALAVANKQISNLSRNYRETVEYNVQLKQTLDKAVPRLKQGEEHVKTLLEGYDTYEAVEARAWLEGTLTAEGAFFNVNDHVWLKLTDRGQEAYRYHWSTYSLDAPTLRTERGYSRFLIWEAMQIFGPYVSIGGDPLFETTAWFGSEPPPKTRENT